MDFLKGFREWFWNHDVWLMPGMSWEDVKSTPENGYPNPDDLLPAACGLAFLCLILRYLFLEPFIVKPFGRAIGIKEQKCKRPPANNELEALFLSNRKCPIPQTQVLKAAQVTGWTERQVQRWLRHRKAYEKPSTIFKLCDCCWQLFYYVGYFTFGMFVMYDKPWFYDINKCWANFPFQRVTADMWWYYMIPLGYYTYMSLTFMIQPKRKDSLQMLVHHIITSVLIIFSYVVNMVRAGGLILFVHECADIPLFLGKISGYAGYNTLMDFLFSVFILCWVLTRLFLFPFWIMKNTMFEAHLILQTMYPVYYILNGLLCILLVFHFIWTYFIIQIIVKKIKTKRTTDVRSESDEISEDFEEDEAITGAPPAAGITKKNI